MKTFLFILFLFSPLIAAADSSTKFIKKINEWEIFKKTHHDESRCMLISHPVTSNGFPGFRDKPYIGFISVKNGRFTFSIYAGFIINKNQPIQVFIDNDVFYLKISREFFAYTYDNDDDERLVKAVMRNDGVMRIRIVSSEMEITNDYYDLKNLYKAFDFVKNHCS